MLETLDEEEELHQDESPVEFFYLWDTKKEIFNLFLTVRHYLSDHNRLNPALIITLCEKRNLDVEEALADLPFILDGYLNTLYPDTPQKDSKNRDEVDDR